MGPVRSPAPRPRRAHRRDPPRPPVRSLPLPDGLRRGLDRAARGDRAAGRRLRHPPGRHRGVSLQGMAPRRPLVLEAFPDHFRGAPGSSAVVFRHHPGRDHPLQRLQGGQPRRDRHPDRALPRGEGRPRPQDPGGDLADARAPTRCASTWRSRPFNDRRLRLAVAHAIDPSGVVQGLLEGCVDRGAGHPAARAPRVQRQGAAPRLRPREGARAPRGGRLPGRPRPGTDHLQLQHRRSQPARSPSFSRPSSARSGSRSSCGAWTGPPT